MPEAVCDHAFVPGCVSQRASHLQERPWGAAAGSHLPHDQWSALHTLGPVKVVELGLPAQAWIALRQPPSKGQCELCRRRRMALNAVLIVRLGGTHEARLSICEGCERTMIMLMALMVQLPTDVLWLKARY